MYKQFKGISSIEDIEGLQEEMIDRFGDYPQQVGYLLQIALIKVLAAQERIESIKQLKQQVTLLFSEQATQTIDGGKLYMLSSSLGTMTHLGMEGSRLKVIIDVKGIEPSRWLTITENLLRGLPNAKKRSCKCLTKEIKKCNSTCIEPSQ
ncbi:hypothetical protein GCM10020331_018790 [Ectobacillus funiculus]